MSPIIQIMHSTWPLSLKRVATRLASSTALQLGVRRGNHKSYQVHSSRRATAAPIRQEDKRSVVSRETGPAATALSKEVGDNAKLGALGRTVSGQPLKIRVYPKFDSLEEERLYRKQHLAAAFRVFADRGFDEGVAGHISVRDPILTDHFCM